MRGFFRDQVEDPGPLAGEGGNFNHPASDAKRDRHPYIEVFRGLKFAPDAEIGKNSHSRTASS